MLTGLIAYTSPCASRFPVDTAAHTAKRHKTPHAS